MRNQLRNPGSCSHTRLGWTSIWPTNSKTQGKDLRVRPTKEQASVLEGQIESRLEQGLKTKEITRELSPWCGQSESTLAIRVKQIRTRVEADQEVAA